jgi:biopolymer transport protein ExbD
LQADGQLFLNQESLKMDKLLLRLIDLRTDDPDLNVIVRGDAKTKYKEIRAVLDICQQANLAKVDLATEISK